MLLKSCTCKILIFHVKQRKMQYQIIFVLLFKIIKGHGEGGGDHHHNIIPKKEHLQHQKE